jgi:hypothetical protein
MDPTIVPPGHGVLYWAAAWVGWTIIDYLLTLPVRDLYEVHHQPRRRSADPTMTPVEDRLREANFRSNRCLTGGGGRPTSQRSGLPIKFFLIGDDAGPVQPDLIARRVNISIPRSIRRGLAQLSTRVAANPHFGVPLREIGIAVWRTERRSLTFPGWILTTGSSPKVRAADCR